MKRLTSMLTPGLLLAFVAVGPLYANQGEASAFRAQPAAEARQPAPKGELLELRWAQVQGTDERVRAGTFTVYENRRTREGRMIHLPIIIVPAQCEPDEKAPDPVFILAGGPGQAAAKLFRSYLESPFRSKRDLVFVSQRGTDGDNRLYCDQPGDDDHLEDYFGPLFDETVFRTCLDRLQNEADLTCYSTCDAMDDLNDVRRALGYDKINLWGGSYGTRAALVYIRQHPETVRTAILNGVAPIAFRNPLYHAKGAQIAIDRIFDLIESDPRYREAFPKLRGKFAATLVRLKKEPARAHVPHPRTGEPVEIVFTRPAFDEALRIMMYYDNRRVPLALERAFEGDFDLMATLALQVNRALRDGLAFGMLLCVTCAEDIDRIADDDVVRETASTFLGDYRVREQMRTCAFWPRSLLPADYGEPVRADVPILILSGAFDPVTPPMWGEEVAKNFPNAVHVVAPGTHGIGGRCIEQIMLDLLERGTIEDLDISCVDHMQLPAFVLPEDVGVLWGEDH